MNQPTVDAASAVLTDSQTLCFHCHDTCQNHDIALEDKYFCCEGCKMVYEILNTHELCDYYAISPDAGVSLKNRKEARAYAFLDDREVREKLISYTDGQTTKVTFLLPQMHCASCIWLLEHLYRLNEGVHSSKVNFLKKEVTILYDETRTTLRDIAFLLASIGYAPEINLHDLDGQHAGIDRGIYYKIGVAGFAFGNIMLLSFPEYLGLEKHSDSYFFSVFGYYNLALALPVLFYSARDYLLSAYQGLRQRHLNIDLPLSLGILALFFRGAWEILSQSGAGYMDSFTGLIFFLLIGKWLQYKTYFHLSFERDYKSYFPVAATLRREGREESVAVSKLEPGDIIVVRNQELIPADGILLKGIASIDYSFVTGESAPVERRSGEKVFAGGRQAGESIEISLTRRVSQSYLTQLWNDEAFRTASHSATSRIADRTGRYFTVIILVLSALALLYWLPKDAHTAINACTAVLIVACPCAIAISIPFTFGNIVRILGRNRFYLKNTGIVEAFYPVDLVVFDKTGTITNSLSGEVRFCGGELTGLDKILVRSLVRHSTHPLSRQIDDFLQGIAVNDVKSFEEIPGRGIRGVVNNHLIHVGSYRFIPGHSGAGEGQPRGVYVQIDGTLKGWFDIRSQYREGLETVVDAFKKDYALQLLSGDNDRDMPQLKTIFAGNGTNLCFHQSPNDKLQYVKTQQAEGKTVMMLGDGLNDAGALQQSNVGVVVTENTNNFTPACDAILHADEFGRLPAFIRFANAGVRIVNASFALAFAYNIFGLSYAMTGTLSPLIAAILMPLSSLTLVLFGMLLSNLRARQLGLLS